MKKIQKILATLAGIVMLSIPIAASAMSTQDFDNGMAKGINYFNSGLYYEAKDEFQWFCDANWGNMNQGQQQYALDYLDGTKLKIQQWENSYKYKADLIRYAKENLSSISDKYVTFYDVRFLFADFTGDGIDELAAVGISDGELGNFQIFQHKNDHIEMIYEDHYGGYEQHNGFIARYNGKYFVGYDSGSSSLGFLKLLAWLNGSKWDKVYGSEWNEVYYSKYEFDYENGGKFIGYTVNGKSAAENEYNAFEDVFYTTQVPIGDFCSISQLQ